MKTIMTFCALLFWNITIAQYPDTTIETPAIQAEAERLTEIYNSELKKLWINSRSLW